MAIVEVRIDISHLEGVFERIGEMQPEINAMLPPIVNRHGQTMRRDTIAWVAQQTGVPEVAIANAIREQLATDVRARYVMQSYDPWLPYVRWRTMRDERVCPVCGPRDDEIYLLAAARAIWPAHPNCRCTLENIPVTQEMLNHSDIVLADAIEKVYNDITREFLALWNSADQ
jgi:hypothetical protein